MKRIIRYITGGRRTVVPKLEAREPLFRDEILNQLLDSDSFPTTVPNFVDDLVLCIGQMSSLMAVVPNDVDDGEPMFPFVTFQKHVREVIATVKPTIKRAQSLKTSSEIQEPKPTDYDARFFGFVAMFFISSSMLQKITEE